jgi:nicotinamidase-related amidase
MKLDSTKTALLTMDLQKGILGLVPAAEAIIPNAVKAVQVARKREILIIHVGLGFSPGHPEIGTNNATFANINPEDIVVYKQRYCAFSENNLRMILRTKGIENLVFFGISTSGIVLSTIRQAIDWDYSCTVIKDACFDRDEEIHRVLTEKVFPAQGKVITADMLDAEF